MGNPQLAQVIDGKKYMWDGKIYKSRQEAEESAKKYGEQQFEYAILPHEDKYTVYTRRVVEHVEIDESGAP